LGSKAPSKPARRVEPVAKSRWLLAAGAIALAAVVLNLPTLHFQFVSWDDSHYVTENPWIRGWTATNLTHIFTQPWFVSYMPLQLVSYVLDYSLWGFKPFGYHLQQLVLHALDSVLAFELVRRLIGRFWLAALAGLFFAVHPAHVESVAWVSARKDVLSALFLIPSVLFYLRARGERSLGMKPYVISIVFFALAVLSKVNVVVMPLFLVLVDFETLRLPRRDGRWWMEVAGSKIPYLAAGGAVSVVNWIVEVKTQASYAKEPFLYMVLKGRTAWDYLWHATGIPRLNPIYDTPPITTDVISILVSLAGLFFLPALVWLGFRLKNRVLTFGAGWMFVMLLPAVFFPVPTYLADRYLYLAVLGFCWLLAAALMEARKPIPLVVTVLVAVVITAFFAVRADRYNRAWATSESLWSYTLVASQDFRAYNNLARERMDQGRWEEALRLFELGSRQSNVTSWEGLTAVNYKMGRYEEALKANDKSFQLHTVKSQDLIEEAELHYKRGTIFLALHRTNESIAELQTALRLNPSHAEAKRILGLANQVKQQGG